MVAVAVWRRFLRSLRTPTQPTILPEGQMRIRTATVASVSGTAKRRTEGAASAYEREAGNLQHSSEDRG